MKKYNLATMLQYILYTINHILSFKIQECNQHIFHQPTVKNLFSLTKITNKVPLINSTASTGISFKGDITRVLHPLEGPLPLYENILLFIWLMKLIIVV